MMIDVDVVMIVWAYVRQGLVCVIMYFCFELLGSRKIVISNTREHIIEKKTQSPLSSREE